MLAAKLMSAMVGASGSGCYIGYITTGDYPNYEPSTGQVIAYANDQIYLAGPCGNQTYRTPKILKLTDSFEIINGGGISNDAPEMFNFVFDGTYIYGGGTIIDGSSFKGVVRLNEARNSAVYRTVYGNGAGAGAGMQQIRGSYPTSDGGIVMVGAYNYDYYDGNYCARPVVAKVNSSGTLVWQLYGITGLSDATSFSEVGVTTGGDIYAGGFSNNSKSVALKLNSSGTFQWANLYTHQMGGMCIDSSGNVYFTSMNQTDGYITKVNSSGGVTWSRQILRGATGSNMNGAPPVVDSSGNVYCVFDHPNYPTGGRNRCVLVKFDSGGNTQWQKTITSSTGVLKCPNYGKRLSIKGDKLYFAGHWQPNAASWYAVVGCLKLDGSVDGTASLSGYTITVAASTYSISTYTNNYTGQTSGNYPTATFSSPAGTRTTAAVTQAIEKAEL